MGREGGPMNVLVTGGNGFLGRAIVARLLARGDTVRSFARGDDPALRADGVDVRRGDLADAEAVSKAVDGTDLVFHVAAKAGVWGRDEDYRRTNVEGTANVLAACRARGVGKLVYTSTPSVVFDGRDMEGADESAPYADHYLAAYPRTKAEAERAVLSADGDGLSTVALRPHLIWGPGDNHLVPRILARARAGALRRVGDGTNVVDSLYIDNAADAHLLAADRLGPGSPVAGRAYFLGQGEPVPLWGLIDRILAAGGLPPLTRSVAPGVAYAAGWALEAFHRRFRPEVEPRMTRFLARELATSHWFDLTAARRDLGYAPAVGLDEGLRRLADSLRGEPPG